MRSVILNPAQWDRLKDADLPLLLPFLNLDDVRVVAVEDDAGEIIASMAVLRLTHYEGAWVSPKHGLGATRALLKKAEECAERWANGWVMAGAADDRMRSILGRMGAAKIPLDTYMLNLGGSPCRLQS